MLHRRGEAEMAQDAARLEEIRQSQDWSYADLAVHIRKVTKCDRDQGCWRHICLGHTSRPHVRTSYAIQRFLEAWDTTEIVPQPVTTEGLEWR